MSRATECRHLCAPSRASQTKNKSRVRAMKRTTDAISEVGDAQVAFEGVGSMPMQRIVEVRQAKEVVVAGEMQRRRSRQQQEEDCNSSRQGSATPTQPLDQDGACPGSGL